MWTLVGDHVGIYGQSREWDLDDPKSFKTSHHDSLLESETDETMVS